MRANTKREDVLLSVLEGVAFAIRDNFEVAKKSGIKVSNSTVCGGGAKSKLWLKIIANVLNIELLLPETEEGPGLGAALLAMTASGNGDKDYKRPSIKEIIRPNTDLVKLYDEKYKKFIKIYPTIKNLYKEM